MGTVLPKIFGEALRRRNARRPGGSIADVGKKDTLPPIRLKIAKYISDGYTLERNLPKALEYLEIARDADPESQAAKKLEPWIDNMRKHINQEK